MTLEPETCYRALSARDPRFDGVFFVGVTSTGIYCRAVCPARLPAEEHCRFFASAASAEREGFRPCLRCRPERAPGRAIVDATSRLARSALARIQAGALNEGSVEDLAASLHVSPRQLRRALRQEYGASPVQLAQTRRLLMSKQLLVESDLPVSRVALASGFGSLRRFNALFRKRYWMTPTELRRRGGGRGEVEGGGLRLQLEYRPPFDWSAILAFLASRAVPGVEAVRDGRYLRTVSVGEAGGWVMVEGPEEEGGALRVRASMELLPAFFPLLSGLRRLFDLDAEPDRIREHLAADARLRPLIGRRPGLRLPGAFDPFEVAVRAVVGQQVSVKAATTVAGRLAERFGEPAAGAPEPLVRHAPTPAALAAADPAEVAALGMPRTRARCVVTLARAVAEGDILLGAGPSPEEILSRLREIPGIGPWTAQYIGLRALHWPDAFPAGDLGLRKALGNVSEAESRRAAEGWRPWRGYAAIHLWESLSGGSTDLDQPQEKP